VVSHWGYWEGGLDPLVSSAVVVHVDKGLGLRAKVGISGKFGGLVGHGVGRDIEHSVVEGLDFSFAEKAEASSNRFVEIWWLLRLGWVK
jgi:hypothetical protein